MLHGDGTLALEPELLAECGLRLGGTVHVAGREQLRHRPLEHGRIRGAELVERPADQVEEATTAGIPLREQIERSLEEARSGAERVER